MTGVEVAEVEAVGLLVEEDGVAAPALIMRIMFICWLVAPTSSLKSDIVTRSPSRASGVTMKPT